MSWVGDMNNNNYATYYQYNGGNFDLYVRDGSGSILVDTKN
jgi:hypothetical protein